MRTVFEIVSAVQEQEDVTIDELRLALLCVFYDGAMASPGDFNEASELKLRLQAKENFERRFRMLKSDPAVYLGPNWTPGSPENKAQREASKRVLAAFQKRQGDKP